jgi:DNA-binding CsgD family transcriptional regulator/tetratricopeptide (TPR) repeat protein
VSEVVGRGPELAAILRWFHGGDCSTLVVEGPAGLGKTTVWAASVDAIRETGARVLLSSPAEAESRLSYSGLADLLADGFASVRPRLAAPQARSLAVAMRLEDPGDQPADETAVARGLLEALRTLGRGAPVLVAIDDLRWLDGPTLSAVLYAARRVDPGDRVRFLTTQRTGALEPAGLTDPATVERVRLGPLTVGGIHRVLRLHAGLSLARPRLLEVHASSAGNPLHALELARALEAGVPLAGGSLATLFQARIAALPVATRRALILIAASADRSTERLERAWGKGFRAALEPAVGEDLVEVVRDHVRPSHPLITHLAYDAGEAEARRDAHRSLAATATNEEERALHLGRSVGGPDAVAAEAVESAARSARARGVRALAASLFESAAHLTPEDRADDRARRMLAAASAWFDSGDTDRVEALLEPLIAVLPAGSQRCEARWRLGKALDEAGRWREAVALWQAALVDTDDLALRSQVLCSLAITALYTETIDAAAELAIRGVSEAEASADRRAMGRSLAIEAFIRALRGEDYHGPMDRALAIEATTDESLDEWSPSAIAAECARHTGDVEAALRHYRAVLDRATAAGDANVEQWAAFGLAWTEIVAGHLRTASELADTVLDLADQTHVMRIPARTLRAHVDAWLGQLDEARLLVREAIDLAAAAEETTHRFGGLAILGTIEAFAGDAPAAARAFAESRALAEQLGLAHASALRMFLAEVEVAAAAGERGQARAAMEAFRATVGGRAPAWARPIVLRAEAALAVLDGDVAAGIAALERSLDLPGILPPDRGRALLALGTCRRRAREYARARDALTEARVTFEALGTPPWIAAVDRELARIPGRRMATGPELTAAEARIAELVAAGRSNKDVAAELVLSVKTVEVTLTRIYEKVGVRSRTELAAHYRRAAGD